TSTGTLLSQGRPATASSTEGGFVAANAVDGNTGTRWGSAFTNSEWIAVDLGATSTITRVVLNWEAAFASGYQIQTATSASGPWTTIFFHRQRRRRHRRRQPVRYRSLRPHERHAARDRLRLLAVGAPGLRHADRCWAPAFPGQAGNGVVGRGRIRCGQRGRRQPWYAVGQRVHQQRVDLRRPRRDRDDHPRGPQLGGGVRERLSDP